MSLNLIDIVVKSVAVSLVGLILAACLRRSSAATRHFVLLLTLAGTLAIPVLAVVVPRWEVPGLSRKVAAASPAATNTVATVAAVEVSPAPAASSIPTPIIVWGLVAIGLGAHLAVRLARLSRMERRLAMSADPKLQALVAAQFRSSGRHVLLLEGSPGHPPMTWGHFRPALLLPRDADRWPEARLRSVVLHELAHIERGDWITSLFAQAACVLCWFNPLAWLIARQMAAESEGAADDRAIVQEGSATQYATQLLEVLKEISEPRSASKSALAMARPGRLEGRLRAILEERRCRRPVRGFAALGLLAGLGGAITLIGGASPRLVREAQLHAAVAHHTPPLQESGPLALSQPAAKSVTLPNRAERVARRVAPVTRSVVKVATPKPTTARPKAAPTRLNPTSGTDISAELSAIPSEVTKALKDAEREVENAVAQSRKEIDTESMPDFAKGIVRDSIKLAESVTNGTLSEIRKGLAALPQKDGKSRGQPSPATKPKGTAKQKPE